MARKQMTLKKCRFVIKNNNTVLRNVDILIEDGRIVDVGKGLGGGEEIKCDRNIVIPGLVNAHVHTESWYLRGISDTKKFFEKIHTLDPELFHRIIYVSSKIAVYEMVSSGITAIVDSNIFLKDALRAVKESGIRARIGPRIEDEKNMKFIEDVKKWRYENPLISPFINVDSIHLFSDDSLREIANISDKYGIDIHFCIAKTRKETYQVKKNKGYFPVEYLNKLGILDNNATMVHLGWVTSWELNMLRDKNINIVYCPTSVMKLATGGFFPLKEALKANLNIGLGTDSVYGNDSFDMFQEMRMCVYLQRNNYWTIDFSEEDVFRMATVNSYNIIHEKGGDIDTGYVADLVLLDADDPNLRPLTKHNILSNIVYTASSSNVSLTIVDGKIVYRRGLSYEKIEEDIASIEDVLRNFLS